jgi:ubiquinone/menaquinone biosynthesis C-methylase UbiE
MQADKYNGTDVSYWNAYYGGDFSPKQPSAFSRFVLDYTEPGKTLIDLGCGNGRDSVFFCHNGLKVTVVDLSNKAIESIDEALPILAICCDFVTTETLCDFDYDYCYARWTIHAINQAQQDVLLPNIYRFLKGGGLCFSESRSINDKKYGQGKPLGKHEYVCDNHYRRFIAPLPCWNRWKASVLKSSILRNPILSP